MLRLAHKIQYPTQQNSHCLNVLLKLTYFVYLKIVEWGLIVRSAGEGTATKVDMVGGTKNKHSLPGSKETCDVNLALLPPTVELYSHTARIHLLIGKCTACSTVRVASMSVQKIVLS